MATRARAQYEITAKDKTDKALASVKRNMKSADDAADSLKRTIGGLGAVTGLVAAALATGAARTTIEFEKLRASLTTVTGSAAAAEEAFDALKAFASDTPFQLQEVVTAFIKLKSLGLEPSEEALRSYGNTASAMGKSLDQFIEAVADAATGEFERLKEFGIKASKQGDQVSLTFKGMTTTIGNSAEEIEGYLRNIGQTDFAGAMTLQMETLGGAVSNMEDSIALLQAAIGEAGLSKVLQSAAGYVSQFAKDLEVLVTTSGEATTVLQGLRDAFGLLYFGTGSSEERLGKLLVEMDNLLILEKKLLEQSQNPLIPDFLSRHHLEQTREQIIKTRSEIEQLQDALFSPSNRDTQAKPTNDPLSSPAAASTTLPVSTEEVAVVTKYWDQHALGIETATEQWRSLDSQVTTYDHDLKAVVDETENLNNVASDLGLTFESAFEDAIINGKGFRDVLGGIFDDIQRIILRKTITEPIGNAVSGFIGGLDFGDLFGGGADFLGSFAVGTNYVPRDGFAKIHKGEAIIPAAYNNGASGINITNSFHISGAGDDGVSPEVLAKVSKQFEGMMRSVAQKEIINSTRNGSGARLN